MLLRLNAGRASCRIPIKYPLVEIRRLFPDQECSEAAGVLDPRPKSAEMDDKPMPESLTRGWQLAQLQGQALACQGTGRTTTVGSLLEKALTN